MEKKMGELQKRFDAFIRHKHMQEYISEKLATTLSDVFSNIVEEAKKEFPSYPHHFSNPSEKYIEMINEWFEKWFIDGKEKEETENPV